MVDGQRYGHAPFVGDAAGRRQGVFTDPAGDARGGCGDFHTSGSDADTGNDLNLHPQVDRRRRDVLGDGVLDDGGRGGVFETAFRFDRRDVSAQ